ncbi:MAG: tRNA uridine-5-carboxymethylaminomethyl(34) synthesis GTPase MnmE [Rhodoferax sp.]|nr:tRNA uridine-5-carboxymethylaminomethyl(34) synthesis GTPase MnmE [Rhodoferax sp.]
MNPDPIAAIATAPGRGAVGILRLSGTGLAPLARVLCGRDLPPRQACYLPFADAGGQPIDHGLALFFPAPHSFTGEDVLELQAHGGPVVLQLLLARCLQAAAAPVPGAPPDAAPCLPGLRLARPGEFSERAFLNDKIDLAQAEAIADLIDASTEAAARSASRSLAGEFSREIGTLREALIHLRMLVEATLDFPEEEIDFLLKADAVGQLSKLQQSLHAVMARAHQGALLREGIKVVIAGQPNAGKSSLLNALAGAELAIVTPVAGTTRDTVRQTVQIEGVPVHVIDTAGLRDSADVVEQIGIARAWDAIAEADAVLFLHDLTRADALDYIAQDSMIMRAVAQKVPESVPVLHVWNKLDAGLGSATPLAAPAPSGRADETGGSDAPNAPESPNSSDASDALMLSARTGQGLDALRRRLLALAGWQALPEGVYMARERHVQALRRVEQHLDLAGEHLAAQAQSLDLLAEELRLAQNALGDITGAFSADDLLGEIFSKFCIGK